MMSQIRGLKQHYVLKQHLNSGPADLMGSLTVDNVSNSIVVDVHSSVNYFYLTAKPFKLNCNDKDQYSAITNQYFDVE